MLRLDLEDPDIGYDARKVDHSNMAGCAESQCPETQRRTKETDLRWKTNFETDYILHARIFPGGSVVKNLSASARDKGSIPGLGRSPGVGNGNPVQYSFFPGKSLGQRSLVGCHPWGHKESDTI